MTTNKPLQSNVRRGAALVVIAGLAFASMSALIKSVSAELSNEMIVFGRNLFGLIVLLPFLAYWPGFTLKTSAMHWHLLRSFTGLAAMYCFFYAISQIPLANAMLLNYTTPLFAPIIVYYWFKEETSSRFKYAAVVGFVGVIFILKPDFSESALSFGALVGMLSGLLAAIALSTVRRMADTESTATIVFYFTSISTLISTIPLFWYWEMPDADQWMLLFLIGALATLGQLSLTRAYQIAEVGKVGPFMYSAVVFAFFYGWLFWLEIPDWLSIVGIVLVTIGGIIALYAPKVRAA